MGPEALAQVLRPLADRFDASDHPDLLRGLGSPDDAAVWRLDGDRALVLTADFFPPVVDDPYHFGAIAAANALSDVFAMGAAPLFGINLVGFPDDMDTAVLTEILRGGADKVAEAGAVVAGGHTTSDKEPKYGLAVVGTVHPDGMLTNEGARPGDALILTKPLGTGIVTTAHKNDAVDPDDLDIAMATMELLNGPALAHLRRVEGAVHALTDVTGFSLAGHAHEMAHLSSVSLRIDWCDVSILPGVESYARRGSIPGGSRRNEAYYGRWVERAGEIEEWERRVLYDPQTSGGLLAAVDADAADTILRGFEQAGDPAWRIGEVIDGPAGVLRLA